MLSSSSRLNVLQSFDPPSDTSQSRFSTAWWVFVALAATLLPVMVFASFDFGVTWDEKPRHHYGELVWEFMRVCAFGSFDKGFDRSWILLEALQQSGAEITYCHFDLWAGHRHKTQLFPWRWLLLAGRYLAGVISISRRFLQSPRCDVLYVGYMK